MSSFRASADWPYHISAGGAVYKSIKGVRHYALLYRGPGNMPRGHEYWSLPKGTLEDNETLESCARREVMEETGLKVGLGVYLGALNRKYKFWNRDMDKVIHYFLMKWQSGDGSLMDDEHERLDWLPADKAIAKLKAVPKGEEEIIKRAEKWLNART